MYYYCVCLLFLLRMLFEKAMTRNFYGRCLLKWEKREQMGAKMQEEAQELLSRPGQNFPSGVMLPYV